MPGLERQAVTPMGLQQEFVMGLWIGVFMLMVLRGRSRSINITPR